MKHMVADADEEPRDGELRRDVAPEGGVKQLFISLKK
jgi:hypothetical protein